MVVVAFSSLQAGPLLVVVLTDLLEGLQLEVFVFIGGEFGVAEL